MTRFREAQNKQTGLLQPCQELQQPEDRYWPPLIQLRQPLFKAFQNKSCIIASGLFILNNLCFYVFLTLGKQCFNWLPSKNTTNCMQVYNIFAFIRLSLSIHFFNTWHDCRSVNQITKQNLLRPTDISYYNTWPIIVSFGSNVYWGWQPLKS